MLATDEVIACFAMYFEVCFEKRRHKTRAAYQKQSQSIKAVFSLHKMQSECRQRMT